MSWLFSQALVEEYLEESSSDGEPSVQSNGSLTQLAYLPPDKMTAFSRLSRFGMTFKPLTADRGEELLMSYRAAFHARTSLQQEKGPGLTASEAGCGEKWRGSFVKYDPASSLWRTHQCSLLGDLEPFLETWPSWGLMRNGECWEQQMSGRLIRETEFGLSEKLPTPQASDYRDKPTSKSWKAKGGVNFSLANPEIQAKWPTPVKSDSQARRPSKGWKGDSDLPSVVWKVDGGMENPEKPPAQLNADWVEWLMGWPLGWTDLKPLEMDKFHSWQQQHGMN
jgi:hypothetical protein